MEPGRNIADFALEFSAAYSALETKRKRLARQHEGDEAEEISDREGDAEGEGDREREDREEHRGRAEGSRMMSLQEIVASYNNSTNKREVINEISYPEFVPRNFDPPRYNGMVLIVIT